MGWNIFTPACLCHKPRLISVTPCLPKPRDSSKAVHRAPSGTDAEEVSVCVCSRQRAMVSLWMEREVKTHLPPSEIPDRQAGRRWGCVELEIHWARLSVCAKIWDPQSSPQPPLHLLRGLFLHPPKPRAIRSCSMCFPIPVYSC